MDDDILKSKPDPKLAIVGVIAFGVGMGLGYILGKRQRKFVRAVPAKKDWTLADLAAVPDKEEIETDELPEEVAQAVETGKSFIEKTLTETPEEPVRQTIFSEVVDDWNYKEEVAKRNEQEPYVLSTEEFHTDERSYSQQTLTYYAGDDILTDEEDKPIYNHSTIIGPLIFGHGSGDPNSFYVRNDKLRAEYEIIRDPGLYSVEILGMEFEENARTEIEHSVNRKFKQE